MFLCFYVYMSICIYVYMYICMHNRRACISLYFNCCKLLHWLLISISFVVSLGSPLVYRKLWSCLALSSTLFSMTITHHTSTILILILILIILPSFHLYSAAATACAAYRWCSGTSVCIWIYICQYVLCLKLWLWLYLCDLYTAGCCHITLFYWCTRKPYACLLSSYSIIPISLHNPITLTVTQFLICL